MIFFHLFTCYWQVPDVGLILFSVFINIAAPAISNGITPASSAVEMDLLALVPVGQPDVESEAKPSAGFTSGPTFAGGPPPPLTNNQVIY